MNNEVIEKIKFTELLTKYDLEPSLIDIYVEGSEDESFYNYHLERMGKNLRFVDISSIEFPESLDLSQNNLENNNRDKILFLLSEINKKIPDNTVYGIIDRDILKYTRGISDIPQNVFLTDFSCIEMYFFCPLSIAKVQQQTFNSINEEVIEKLQLLTANFSLIVIAEKNLKLSINKINSDKLFKSKFIDFNKFTFNLEKYLRGCLAQSNLSTKYDFVNKEISRVRSIIGSENPINYINGHNFVNILTGYIAQTKSFRQIKDKEVCNIYKNAVETVFLEDFPLFKKLMTI